MHLIADTGKRFLAAEHGENVEDPRRGRPAGQRRSERLGNLAELIARLVGKLPHRGLERRLRPGSTACKPRQERGKRLAAASSRILLAISSIGKRARGEQKGGVVEQLDQRLARSFSPGMARSSLLPAVVADPRRKRRAVGKLGHQRLQALRRSPASGVTRR